MLRCKFFCLLPTILCVLWPFTECAKADDLSANASASPPHLQVSIVNESPTWQAVLRAYVTVGTNKLAFLLPDGFRMESNNSTQNAISFVNGECNCWLTFRIAAPPLSSGRELNAQPLREMLLNRHPRAKILEEFSLVVAGGSVPAFDLQWETSSGLFQRMRVVFVPSSAGILELALLTNVDNFSKFQNAFNSFLLGFRTSVGNTLETVPRSTGV